MAHRINMMLAAAAVVALQACAPASAPHPAPGGSGVASRSAAGIGAALNAYRQARQRAPLAADPALTRAAGQQAQYLASTGKTGHSGRGGSSVMDRVRAEGLKACLVAENLAFGYPGPAEAVSGWKGSAGHRRNMLLSGVTHYGAGRVGDVMVLVLARPC